jgi:phosphoglycolate phosphatase
LNIFFDLDGTLTDSGAGITRCLQHALARLGRDVPAAETLRRFLGPPLHETFAELLQTPDGGVVDAAVRFYRERYVETGMFENELYPGVPEALESLARDGHRIWVVTSKYIVYADRIVDHFGLRGWLQRVYGAEHSGINADKRRLIRHALDEAHLDARGTWMVGDRMHDVRGARENGVSSIAALWGYGSADELREAQPDHLATSMREVGQIITRAGGTE